MYAIGSRQELEALTKQLEANHRMTRHLVEELARKSVGPGVDTEALTDALDAVSLCQLLTAMLSDAMRDHFNGKN